MCIQLHRRSAVPLLLRFKVGVTLSSEFGRFKGFFLRAEDANALEKRGEREWGMALKETGYRSSVFCHNYSQNELSTDNDRFFYSVSCKELRLFETVYRKK